MVTLFPDGGNGDIPCGPSGRAHPYALIPSKGLHAGVRASKVLAALVLRTQKPVIQGFTLKNYSHLTMLFPTHITVTSYLEVEGPEWEAVGVTHGFLERGVASYANFAHQFHWPFLNDVSGVWAPKSDPWC